MIIKVRVVPNSREESMQKTGERTYRLKLREKAIEGRANVVAIEKIAAYFGVRKSEVILVRGAKSREKAILIPDFAANAHA